jgi:serine/threonine protein kinase
LCSVVGRLAVGARSPALLCTFTAKPDASFAKALVDAIHPYELHTAERALLQRSSGHPKASIGLFVKHSASAIIRCQTQPMLTMPTNPTPNSSAPQSFVFNADAAHQLLGKELPGGWNIIKKIGDGSIPGEPDGTGGHFSVGYIAERKGKQGFVKVFDLGGAMREHPDDVMAALGALVNNHQYETSLLSICENAKLDRVVRVLEQNQVILQAGSGMGFPLPFIVFEMAEQGDFRRAVARSAAIDYAWRLRIIHQVAVGLQQLHGVAIAHQDLKPSNVLVFEGVEAKLADLGRASRNDGRVAAHDGIAIAGAIAYAPPEQAYGVMAEEWRDRREGCDLYHLGCLICFAFTGTTPTQAYSVLPENIRPVTWGGTWAGTYDMVYPQIAAAFAAYLDKIQPEMPDWAADQLLLLIQQLCTPEYKKRGAPEARVFENSPLGLDRFITRLDRLALAAKIRVKTA